MFGRTLRLPSLTVAGRRQEVRLRMDVDATHGDRTGTYQLPTGAQQMPVCISLTAICRGVLGKHAQEVSESTELISLSRLIVTHLDVATRTVLISA
jgi:hypothetical protein